MLIYLILLVPLVLAVGLVLYVWISYFEDTLRWVERAAPMPPAIQTDNKPDGEECECVTSDGLTIAGTYVPTTCHSRAGVVVFCHELFGNRWSAMPYIASLRQNGFDVFTFEFRNHGSSDKLPGYSPKPQLTRHDLRDLSAVIDYLNSRDDADPRGVALIGASKGANVALYTAASDSRVWSVTADGAFSLDWVTAFYMWRFASIYIRWGAILRIFPFYLFLAYAKIIQHAIAKRMGEKTFDILKIARRIEQPVLLVHGGSDAFVPAKMAREFQRRMKCKEEMWIVKGANHNGAIRTEPEEYNRRVAAFLAKHSEVWTMPEAADQPAVIEESRPTAAAV